MDCDLFHASLRRRKFSWDSTPHLAQIHAHFWDTATDSRHFGRKSVCATPPSAFRSVPRRTLLAGLKRHGVGHRCADALRSDCDVPVREVCIAQCHSHVGVTEESRDHGYGHAVHDGMTRHGVSQIVDAHILNSSAAT